MEEKEQRSLVGNKAVHFQSDISMFQKSHTLAPLKTDAVLQPRKSVSAALNPETLRDLRVFILQANDYAQLAYVDIIVQRPDEKQLSSVGGAGGDAYWFNRTSNVLSRSPTFKFAQKNQ